MAYTPKWLTADTWRDTGTLELPSIPPQIPADAKAALEEFGLPREVPGMFYPCERCPHLDLVELPDGRHAHALGQNETGVPGVYCVDSAGAVVHWDGRTLRHVNTSLPAFLDALAAWKSFLDAFPEDDFDDEQEEARTSYGKQLAKDIKKADRAAYRKRGSWWGRVYEDVRLGAL